MNNLSLVEKYRPNKIENILGQNNIVKALQKTIIKKNIPHLLFYGPSGVGKTSLALALVKTLYNKDNYQARVLELNASDERGIQIVREKIKNFAKMSINNDKYAKFKVIILDEADSMTLETQLALRYIIEQYSKFTRFIIICNYINKIIEPIISRCALYRFKPIKKNNILYLLTKISNDENINLSKKNLNNIFEETDGDLRYTINLLERYKLNHNSYVNNVNLNKIIKNYIKKLLKKDKTNILFELNNLLNKGISANEIIIEFLNTLMIDNDISEDKKIDIFIKISDIDSKLKNGCEDYIQIIYLSQLVINNI